MSERMKPIIVGVVCTLIGVWSGMHRGRAEMKLWQDSYYAAHPSKVEINLPDSFKGGIVGLEFSLEGYKTWYVGEVHVPTPAPPAKSAKATIWTPKPNVIYCGDRPCSEFSAVSAMTEHAPDYIDCDEQGKGAKCVWPKPAKGSKRYPTEYERGYEAAFRDLQSHSALTIPMPQVERDKPCPKMPEGVQYAIVCGPQPIPEKEPHLTPDQWLQEHPLITCTASIPPICDDAPAVKP